LKELQMKVEECLKIGGSPEITPANLNLLTS
jgi:hypothetical protein